MRDGSPSTSRCGRSALHPGEIYAGLAAPAPTFWALRPKPRPTFSRRESRQRYARNLLVPGPPAKGASPPLIPRPCALAVLVEGVQGLRHPRGAARQSGLPIAFPLFRKKLLDARWGARAAHDSAGRCGRRGRSRLSDRDKIWGRRGQNSFLPISYIKYLLLYRVGFCPQESIR